MTRKRALHRYPEEYYELFERTHTANFALTFESKQRAYLVRTDLYNLRAAVRDAVTLDPDNEELNARYLLMEPVVISLRDNELHFRLRSYVNDTHVRRLTNAQASSTIVPSAHSLEGFFDF